MTKVTGFRAYMLNDVADNAIGSLDLAISNIDDALSALEEAQA